MIAVPAYTITTIQATYRSILACFRSPRRSRERATTKWTGNAANPTIDSTGRTNSWRSQAWR